MTKLRTILGIDPGTVALGYGIIHTSGQKLELVNLGTVHLSKLNNQQEKLRYIFERISYLIKTYKPAEVAIESPFYGKNVQSMLKLGRAQGVCMVAALIKDIDVFEYSPKKIKMAVTGNGNSSKEQVASMLQQICKFDRMPNFLDATDGLATAVCHHLQSGSITTQGKKLSSWKAFMDANPNRIRK